MDAIFRTIAMKTKTEVSTVPFFRDFSCSLLFQNKGLNTIYEYENIHVAK